MNGNALQLTLREMQAIYTSPRAIGVMVATIVILGLSGPFHTFTLLPPGPRFAYWATLAVCTFTAGTFFGTWAINQLRAMQVPKTPRILAGGVAAGIPVSLVVLAINFLAFEKFDFDGFSWLPIVGYCLAISSVISMLFVLFKHADQKTAPNSQAPKIMARLAMPQRGKLVSLSVQDHYVEVTTTKGKSLVLIRLSDAITETGGVEGLQVHRSHWVALDGVKSANRRDGKVIIVTNAGAEMPVSRTYVGAVKEAGLLV